jgi:hypothetical protein
VRTPPADPGGETKEVVMTKRTLSIVALAVVLAALAPLSVTTSAAEVNCRVPFSFVAGGKALPLGSYTVSTSHGYMMIKGLSGQSAIVLGITGNERADGRARLVFLKTGDRYDLSEVWSGDGAGLQIPPTKRQVEARRASNAPPERIVILAM